MEREDVIPLPQLTRSQLPVELVLICLFLSSGRVNVSRCLQRSDCSTLPFILPMVYSYCKPDKRSSFLQHLDPDHGSNLFKCLFCWLPGTSPRVSSVLRWSWATHLWCEKSVSLLLTFPNHCLGSWHLPAFFYAPALAPLISEWLLLQNVVLGLDYLFDSCPPGWMKSHGS